MNDRDVPGCLWVAPALVVIVCCALAALGCGSTAIRQHAQAATIAHDAVATAGGAIEASCGLALAAGHDVACVDATGARCVTAAAARDALVLPVEAYRDGVLAAAADDGRVSALVSLALDVVAAWPAFAAALSALGLDVPSLPGVP